MMQCAKWLLRARPADYALALSVAGASLPVVGKHLEPLGGLTAMSVWGARLAPEAISAMTKEWLTPGINEVRRRDRESTQQVSLAALRGVVSAADLDAEWPVAVRTPPMWEALRARPYLYRRAVHYGDHPAQRARRLAAQGSARATRAGADLRPGRRLGARPQHAAGIRADVLLWPRRAGCAWRSTIAPPHTIAGHATSSMSRPLSPGLGPTSTNSAAIAISLRWPDVRPVGTWPRWPDSLPTTRSTNLSCRTAPTARWTR